MAHTDRLQDTRLSLCDAALSRAAHALNEPDKGAYAHTAGIGLNGCIGFPDIELELLFGDYCTWGELGEYDEEPAPCI